MLLTVPRVHRHEPRKRIAGLIHHTQNDLAVRRPCGIVESLPVQSRRERSLLASIERADDQPVLPRLRIVIAHECDVAAVRRECDVRIDILRQSLGSAAEKRSAVEITKVRIAGVTAHEVKIVTVRRKSQPVVVDVGGRLYLRVAVGRHVAQPQAYLAVALTHEAQDVLAVGRNCDQRRFALLSQPRHREIAEWPHRMSRHQRVNSIPGGHQDNQTD